MEDEWLTKLVYGKDFDEVYPTWSPDGLMLAVVRRAWIDGVPESGNQVWTMRPDGIAARQLTNADNTTFGNPPGPLTAAI